MTTPAAAPATTPANPTRNAPPGGHEQTTTVTHGTVTQSPTLMGLPPEAPTPTDGLPVDGVLPKHAEIFRQDLAAAVKRGTITQAQADDALASEGLAPSAPPLPKAVQAHDSQFPKVKAHELDMPSPPPTPEGKTTDAWFRKVALATEMPKGMANAVIAEVDRVSRTYPQMDAGQKAAYQRDQVAQAHKALGPKAKEKLLAAGKWLQGLDAKVPGVGAYLTQSGALHSAAIAIQVVAQMERDGYRASLLAKGK